MKSCYAHFLPALPRWDGCVCAHVCAPCERVHTQKDRAEGGGLPAFCTTWGSRARGHLGSVTRSLSSKRLASLSRSHPAPPGSPAAAGVSPGGAGVLSRVPSRGTCLLRRSPHCAGAQRTRASVCPCVHVRVGACTLPVAAPPRAPLVWRGGRAACCGSAVASSDPCALSEPIGRGACGSAGIFSVLHVSQGGVSLARPAWCVSPACMDFSGSVFCAECHPSFCDHPCRFWKWLGKPATGVGGGPGRGPFPSLPPRSPRPPRSIFLCRKEQAQTAPMGDSESSESPL